MKQLPEAVKGEQAKVEPVFLRTVIKREVHEKLKVIAQQYSTGQGNWDFGVAIQVLLEFYDSSKLALQSDKLDLILNMLNQKQNVEPQEEDFIELLGGDKIKKKG